MQDVTAGDNASIYTSLQMKNAWEEGGEGDDREEVGMIEWRSGWQRVGGATGVKDIETMLGEEKSAKNDCDSVAPMASGVDHDTLCLHCP